MSRNKKQIKKDKKQAKAKMSAERKLAGKLSLYGLLVAGLGMLLYLNTLGHQYALDDFSVLKENFLVKRGFAGLGDIMKTSYRFGYWNEQGTLYRPLSLVMFALEWEFFPDTPRAYHFFNLFFYGLLGFVMFKVLRNLMRDYTILLPLIISLLFIAHPIHTEVVANIKSRDEIMSLLFVFTALGLLLRYIESNKIWQLAAAVGVYFLAFLAKESALTFLAVFPAALFMFRKISLHKIMISTAVMGVAAAAYIGMRAAILGSVKGVEKVSVLQNSLEAAPDLLSRTATAFVILGKYVLLLLFPHPMACDYSFNQIPNTTFGDFQAFLPLLFFLGIGIYAVWKFRNRNLISFGILVFLATISLYSNLIITIGTQMGDRLLFVPSLGFAIVVAVLLVKAFKINLQPESEEIDLMQTVTQHKGILALLGVVLLAYSYKTFDRNKAWENDYTLYSTDVLSSPNSARMNYYYGLALVQHKAVKTDDPAQKNAFLDQGIAAFEKAIEIYPNYGTAWDQIGLAHYRKDNYPKAVEFYNKALQLDPTMSITYSNLGTIYFKSQQYENALGVYQKAVQYNPRYADGYMNLGSTYGMLGRPQEAVAAFRKALEFEPNNAVVHRNLAITFSNMGDVRNAQFHAQQAKKLDPNIKI